MIEIKFLGTRGNTEITSEKHKMYTTTMFSKEGFKLMIDCGKDWETELQALNPDAILITHAHPDHAWGLLNGAPCPVYLTEIAYSYLKSSLKAELDFRLIESNSRFSVGPFSCIAVNVEHSTVAPAVGYRIDDIFYTPDLIEIENKDLALRLAKLYIGDGASFTKSIIRVRGKARVGHIMIPTQLDWCVQYAIPLAIFTHCGTELISNDERIERLLQQEAQRRNMSALIAYDGMECKLN